MATRFYEQFRKVPFLKILSFYGIGIFIANAIDANEKAFLLIKIMLFCTILIVAISFFYRNRNPLYYNLFFYVFLFLTGFWNYWRTDFKIAADHFAQHPKEQLLGIITEEPIVRAQSIRLIVRIVGVADHSKFKKASGLLMLTINRDSLTVFTYGDQLVIAPKIVPTAAAYNPLEFDYKRYLAYHNVYFQAYLNRADYKILKHHQGHFIKAYALQMRQKLISKFHKYMADEESFQIAVALILGYRSTLSTDTLQTFSNTGTIHVLSVSGMHVGILFIILIWLLQSFRNKPSLRIIRFVVLICVIWTYTILTGMAPSILRSALMLSFVIISTTIKRERNMLNTMASSAFLLLLFEPKMMFDIGFQLSYCAVLGIVLIHPLLQNISPWKSNLVGHIIWQSASVSISAQATTSALALFYFGQFPVYFLLANLIVALPVTGIMYAGLLLMISPFEALNMQLAHMLMWMIKSMIALLHVVDALPFSVWKGIVFTGYMVFLATVIFSFLLYAIYWKKKRALLISMLSILLLLLLFSKQQFDQFNYVGFRIYNTRKELTMAFIHRGHVDIISTFDSLNSANLRYAAARDLNQFTAWESINFHALSDKDAIRSNYSIQAYGQVIQILEHDLFEDKPTDILIVRKNNKRNFVPYIKSLRPKLVVFDATNSDANIQKLTHLLDSLRIAHYNIKNNYAYVWDEE